MSDFEKCINCGKELDELEEHLCYDCDFTNKVKIEFTIEIHNLDTEKFCKSINDFGERLNTSQCKRLSDLNTNGFNEINLNNMTSIKIKDVIKHD